MSAAGSLLESFFILFSSDAEEVDQGAKDATDSSDKLEKKLKNVDKQAKKTGDSFSSMAKKAVNTLLPLIGLKAMTGAVLGFAEGAEAAGHLAHNLQMDVEALQAWQGAATHTGGSADAFAGSMKSLNDKIYEMQRFGGGEAASVFYRLGVSIRDSEGRVKTGDKMLLDLSDKLAGLSRQRALKLGEQLGLDEGTVDLLRKGKKGVEEMLARQKELGVYSKKDAEEARKFKAAKLELGQAFWSVAAVVMRVLLPVFTDMAEGMTSIALSIREHKDLVTGFFIALSVIMGLLALKAMIAFAPFFLFAAIVLLLAAAFAVAYDDIMNFMDGNDSVIGRLSEKYPWLGELVKNLVATFKDLWEIVKAVGTLLVEAVENPAQAWENFTRKIGPLFDAFCERFPELGQLIKDLGVIFGRLFELAWPIMKAIGKIVIDVISVLVDGICTIGGWIAKAIRWVAGKITGEVEVTTGNDPKPKPEPNPEDPDDDPQGAFEDGKGWESGARGRYDNDDFRLPSDMPPDLAEEIRQGQRAVAQTNIPITAAASAASARPQEVSRTYQIKVDKVEVQTQATDAEGISRDVGGALERQMQSAAENFDDGVLA